MIRHGIGLTVLASVVLLQGCAAPPRTPLPAPVPLYVGPPPHRVPQLASRPPPRPPMLQQPLPPENIDATPAPVAPVAIIPQAAPPATAPAPPVAAPLPATVVGLSRDEVRARLGAPAVTSDSGPAQTWTYRTDGCSLYIAFFFDVTRNGFFALSQHATSPQGDQPACLARLAAAHAN